MRPEVHMISNSPVEESRSLLSPSVSHHVLAPPNLNPWAGGAKAQAARAARYACVHIAVNSGVHPPL